MRLSGPLGALCLLTLPFALDAQSPPHAGAPGLSVTTTGTEIQVVGASPGGQVVLVGVQREPIPGASSIATWARAIADDDADGSVGLDLERPVAIKSAWAAIDMATGDVATATGPGFVPKIVRLGADSLEVDPETGEIRIRFESEVLQIVLIRPTVGAWATRAYDGGNGDADGAQDFSLHFETTSLRPLLPEFGDFANLQDGDKIGAVDERNLTLFLLDGADAPPAQ